MNVQVQVSFKATSEVFIDDQPILRCKVIDGDGGEAIASIPIKLSVKSVYAKLACSHRNIHPCSIACKPMYTLYVTLYYN